MPTPAKVLESAKRRFPVLLHGTGSNEAGVLEQLTIDAIREYQDRAGFSGEVIISSEQQELEGGVPLPDDWLEKTGAQDSRAVFVLTLIYDKEVIDKVSGDTSAVKYIKSDPDYAHVAPYKVLYWRDVVALLDADNGEYGEDSAFNTVDLPSASVGIISKYLELLISIPNNERLQEAYRGMDHPGAENIQSADVLMERKASLELEMDEMQDFLPPIMVL